MRDKSLVETVVSDLEYLGNTWGSRVDDNTLRRGSTQLRLLLIDNTLQKAWKAVGFQREPIIIAPRLETLLDSVPSDYLLFAQAGGGNYEGTRISCSYLIRQLKGSQPVTIPEGIQHIEHPFGLRELGRSCALFIEGRRIARAEVIKYVANKLGGAHLDFSRSAIATESVYQLLDRRAAAFMIGDKNAVYYELLSIGQLLARAPDVQKLIGVVRSSTGGNHPTIRV